MTQVVYQLGSRAPGTFVSEDRVVPGTSVVFQARLCANEGTGQDVTGEGDALKQADVSTISRSIYLKSSSTPSTAVSGPTSLTVSTVIEDTLTNGNEQWTLDDIGRNFADTVSSLTTANGVYHIEYTITLASGNVMKLLFQQSTSAGGSS